VVHETYEGSTSSYTQWLDFSLLQDGDGTNFRGAVPIGGSMTLAGPPVVLAGGSGFGVAVTGAPVTIQDVCFWVMNVAGTQKHVIGKSALNLTLTTGSDVTLDMSGWDVYAHVGTDLSWSAGLSRVVSTAGGVFFSAAMLVMAPA
jgi:hypothetical protein